MSLISLGMSGDKTNSHSGKLRIGDDWNAITIIALSQANPLKAVAEFVENSIDAGARQVTVTRGREKNEHFLRIKDDGEGIRQDEQGLPDFRYVATHICDSIKRRLKAEGAEGLQGEFGIGLLSFWTVGEHLYLSSTGADGKLYQMHLRKGAPTYEVTQRRALFAEPGVELTIKPVLPGLKQLSGEKIQWYLASELRDRIRHSGVEIKVIDRTARAEFKVEPRKFEGRLLHELGKALPEQRPIYLELYLNRHDPGNAVGLYRLGTRVLDQITLLPAFQKEPWTSGFLQGIVDAGYLNLTPGTRSGIIYDEALDQLGADLAPIEKMLLWIIEEQQRAEEERASHDVLRSIQKALREALLALPAEEYDWFEVRAEAGKRPMPPTETDGSIEGVSLNGVATESTEPQKQFFEYAGPLYSVKMSPASAVVPVNGLKNIRAIPRDRARHVVEQDVSFQWQIVEGEGRLENETGEIVTFHAAAEPGLVRIRASATQGEVVCQAEGLITVAESLLPEHRAPDAPKTGIPGYTFQKAPGELWRSKFLVEQNVVVVNNGHRDFVFASRSKALKLRYICRLYSKELVLKNFVGMPSDQLLERLLELSLYTEENLK